MEPIVIATWGLVVVTLLLVVITFVGIARAERHAAAQRTELADQTAALVDGARASQAMADEMFEARRAARPLELGIQLAADAGAGWFRASLLKIGALGIVLIRSEILVGRERVPACEPVGYGNFYLGGSTNTIDVNEQIDAHGRDLLTLRVTGIPENGREAGRRVPIPGPARRAGLRAPLVTRPNVGRGVGLAVGADDSGRLGVRCLISDTCQGHRAVVDAGHPCHFAGGTGR
jgi:hypothetical protein